MIGKNNDEISSPKPESEVLQISKISMYYSLGPLDAGYPFQPFGPNALKESYFIFGSREWLNKSISKVTIQLFWEKDIPSNFAGYYSAYSLSPVNKNDLKGNNLPLDFQNTSFKVAFSVLKDGEWKSLYDKSFSLFEENEEVDSISHISTFNFDFDNNLVFTGTTENSEIFEYNEKMRNGFIKMQLVAPEYGFGANLYSDVLNRALLGQAKWAQQKSFWGFLKLWKKNILLPLIPSLPYVPLLDKIDIKFTYLNPLNT